MHLIGSIRPPSILSQLILQQILQRMSPINYRLYIIANDMKKKVFYLKIVVSLVFSFLAVQGLSQTVFLASTPRLRPNLLETTLARLSSIFDSSDNIAERRLQNAPPPSERLQNVPFIDIAKGVQAKGDGSSSYTVINEAEVDWVEYHFTVKGQQLVIRVPKGAQPPTQEQVERQF